MSSLRCTYSGGGDYHYFKLLDFTHIVRRMHEIRCHEYIISFYIAIFNRLPYYKKGVQQLYAHCALNTSFYSFHCAIIALPLSRDRNVQQLYTHCALIRCFYPLISHAIIALPLRFVGLFALILRPHCAATETVALMINFKVLFRCFQLLHNAFMLRFHFRLTFSTPLHCSRQSADPLRLF